MPAKSKQPTTRTNYPLHVLLMTRGPIALSYAGPGLTVKRLLRTHEQSSAKTMAMSAVFGDRVINSYQALAVITRASTGQSTTKRQPGSLRFSASFALSVVRFIINMGKALKGLRRQAVVILHSHDLISAYLSSLLYHHKYPLLFTLHGKGGYVREPMIQFPVFHDTPVEKFFRHIETTAIRRADIVIFTSRGSQMLFENEYPGLLQGKDVRIVYPGVDIGELDSVSVDRELLRKYRADGKSVILCIAALVKDKGVDTLIQSIGSLPNDIRSNLSCLIVGRGHLKEELQSLIVEAGLTDIIKILDFLPRERLLELMKVVDLFVLPSRVSVFDQVLLEVAAVGLPVITTAVGGNLEMYDRNSASMVPPNDSKALATAITQMLTDEKLRKQLAENARQRTRSRFSPENEFNSYVTIYKEMTSHN